MHKFVFKKIGFRYISLFLKNTFLYLKQVYFLKTFLFLKKRFFVSLLISWKSQKQRSVARSTTEAGCVALSECVQKAIWLRRLLGELGFKQEKPTVICEDNQGAIDLSKNPKFHNRTKHIDISYHLTREKIASEEIVMQHCASNEMLADVMTKPVAKPQFSYMLWKINILPISE